MIYLKITADLVCGWSGWTYYLGMADDHEIFEQSMPMPDTYPEDEGVQVINADLDPAAVFMKLLKALQEGGTEKAQSVLASIQNGGMDIPKSVLWTIEQIAPQVSWAF